MGATLDDRSLEIEKLIHAAASEGVHEFGQQVAEEWRKTVHVISGEFRDSIEYEKLSELSGEVGSDVKQAVFEEFGTKHNQRHPSLGPLIERKAREFETVLANKISSRLK